MVMELPAADFGEFKLPGIGGFYAASRIEFRVDAVGWVDV